MADRARSYERAYRIRHGITALSERLARETDATVMAGPFTGMVYPRRHLADVGAPGAKLAGTYEHEIAHIFDDALRSGVDVFVDVGSAEGYYVVGMALAAAGLTAHAYDLSRSARRLCGTLAELNGVADRVRIGRRCDADALARLPLDGALLLCDIEGDEDEFFDARTVGLLRRTRVVVEAHDGLVPGLGQRVTEAFAQTHAASVISQRTQVPDDARFSDWTASEIALATTASRRVGDHWIDLVPRP